MSNIKKQFQEIYAILEANKSKKVSTIFDQLEELMKAKTQQKTFITNENNEVVAIYCYYHKKWELVSNVEYGQKASTASGLNTMCKEGVREWTKAKKDLAKGKEALMNAMLNGDLEQSDLANQLAILESESKNIKESEANKEYSFDTLEEVLEAIIDAFIEAA